MEPEFNVLTVLEVTAEDELLENFAVRVLVSGDALLPFEGTLQARFDDEPVEALARNMHCTGFTGYLKNEPPDGTRLFVTLGGQEEVDTGLIYSRATGPNV